MMLPRSGLYAITPEGELAPETLLAQVEQALAGGASLIQYRDKDRAGAGRPDMAAALLARCRYAQVPLIVNDDLDLAVAIGADGVHLGRDDAPPALARARLGNEAIIGVSCYADLERARAAVAAGADYVAFGRFFPSPTKPEAPPAPLALLAAARRTLNVPLVAIGGITPDNARQLLRAGADLLAVISGVFAALDIQAAARVYTQLIAQEHSR